MICAGPLGCGGETGYGVAVGVISTLIYFRSYLLNLEPLFLMIPRDDHDVLCSCGGRSQLVLPLTPYTVGTDTAPGQLLSAATCYM